MTTDLQVIAFCGSLREGSLNRTLLDLAIESAPGHMDVVAFDFDDVPFYRAELDGDDKPPSVLRLKHAIDRADGMLFVTPEYNHGVPGVLKNAIDWASRPAFGSPMRDKPATVLSASPAETGAAIGQAALKQVLLGTASAVMPYPSIAVGQAGDRLTGDIPDETRDLVAGLMDRFASWIESLQGFGANEKQALRAA